MGERADERSERPSLLKYVLAGALAAIAIGDVLGVSIGMHFARRAAVDFGIIGAGLGFAAYSGKTESQIKRL